MKRSLEESLGISVITYNRANRLDGTLDALFRSPFRNCAITVFDNCSSDNTATICARHAAQFPKLRVVRHRVNIGLSANYLRAVELSETPYTWVLGDDDELDTSSVGDIVDVLRGDEADLLIVGAVNQPTWNLGRMSKVRELLEMGFPYFYVTGWITGVMFRTELFDSQAFHLGYKNSDNVFPHFPFFAKCVALNRTTYVAKQWIAGSREGAEYGRLGSVMLAGWMHSARYLEESRMRRASILQGPVGQGQPVNYARSAVMFFKAFAVHNLVQRRTILDTWLKAFAVASWDVRLILLPSFVHLLCPESVARAAFKVAERLGGTGRRPEKYAAALDEART